MVKTQEPKVVAYEIMKKELIEVVDGETVIYDKCVFESCWIASSAVKNATFRDCRFLDSFFDLEDSKINVDADVAIIGGIYKRTNGLQFGNLIISPKTA